MTLAPSSPGKCSQVNFFIHGGYLPPLRDEGGFFDDFVPHGQESPSLSDLGDSFFQRVLDSCFCLQGVFSICKSFRPFFLKEECPFFGDIFFLLLEFLPLNLFLPELDSYVFSLFF